MIIRCAQGSQRGQLIISYAQGSRRGRLLLSLWTLSDATGPVVRCAAEAIGHWFGSVGEVLAHAKLSVGRRS